MLSVKCTSKCCHWNDFRAEVMNLLLVWCVLYNTIFMTQTISNKYISATFDPVQLINKILNFANSFNFILTSSINGMKHLSIVYSPHCGKIFNWKKSLKKQKMSCQIPKTVIYVRPSIKCLHLTETPLSPHCVPLQRIDRHEKERK